MPKTNKSLSDFSTRMANLMEEIAKNAKNAIGEEFTKFFDKHPEIKSVTWTQYTPYFMDGDACVFGVNLPEVAQVKLTDSTDEDKELQWGSEEYKAHEKAVESALKDLRFITSCDEAFKAAFDDHVKITATREGFEVDEYSHD